MTAQPQNPFAPATRQRLKARVALDGPTGSGKTWSALAWATELGDRIALVDTEAESASLYSDRFSFDTLPWFPPYDPRKLAETVKAAEANGYDVLVIDSLTHFWKGEGGVMDIVDAAAARGGGGNKFAGWKTGTPALRTLIDTLLASSLHVVVTMRSKMEHILVENERGRLEPTKVGMAPEMRNDIEYEFTVCVSYDLDHRGTVTKSRCEALADVMIPAGLVHLQETAGVFLDWLHKGAPEAVTVTEDRRAYLRAWANGFDRAGKDEVRRLWPVGVPQLTDERLTDTQADRIERVLSAVGKPPKDDPPPKPATKPKGRSAQKPQDAPETDSGTPPQDSGPEAATGENTGQSGDAAPNDAELAARALVFCDDGDVLAWLIGRARRLNVAAIGREFKARDLRPPTGVPDAVRKAYCEAAAGWLVGALCSLGTPLMLAVAPSATRMARRGARDPGRKVQHHIEIAGGEKSG